MAAARYLPQIPRATDHVMQNLDRVLGVLAGFDPFLRSITAKVAVALPLSSRVRRMSCWRARSRFQPVMR